MIEIKTMKLFKIVQSRFALGSVRDHGTEQAIVTQNGVTWPPFRLRSHWPTSLPEKSVAGYVPKCPFLSLRQHF